MKKERWLASFKDIPIENIKIVPCRVRIPAKCMGE